MYKRVCPALFVILRATSWKIINTRLAWTVYLCMKQSSNHGSPYRKKTHFTLCCTTITSELLVHSYSLVCQFCKTEYRLCSVAHLLLLLQVGDVCELRLKTRLDQIRSGRTRSDKSWFCRSSWVLGSSCCGWKWWTSMRTPVSPAVWTPLTWWPWEWAAPWGPVCMCWPEPWLGRTRGLR